MNTRYRDDFSPIEDGCECYVCKAGEKVSGQGLSQADGPRGSASRAREDSDPARKAFSPAYSRAYLAHLFHAKEMLAATLASIHNVYFIVNLVKNIRQSILDERFFEFKEEFLKQYLGK